MKYYKISETRLLELINAYYELGELQTNGVDNWEGYEDCGVEPVTEIDITIFKELN